MSNSANASRRIVDGAANVSTSDKALNVSEIRYRRLFETARDGILLLNAETGQIEDVNPFLVEMLGYSHAEFLGKNLWEVGPFKNTALTKEAFIELQHSGYIRYENLPLETIRGTQVEVEFVSNVYDCDGTKVIQCNIRDITERKRAEARILYLAYHDVLTDLPNRALFYDRLDQAILFARREHHEVALLYLDLDKFKVVNDTFGHTAGDEVLKIVAGRIRGEVRESDTVARIGGDEFTVILPKLTHRESAALIAQKIIDACCAPCYLDAHKAEACIGLSIGIAIFPAHGAELDTLIKAADTAMYEAKRVGNRFRLAE